MILHQSLLISFLKIEIGIKRLLRLSHLQHQKMEEEFHFQRLAHQGANLSEKEASLLAKNFLNEKSFEIILKRKGDLRWMEKFML